MYVDVTWKPRKPLCQPSGPRPDGIYAYANGSGGIDYQLPGGSGRIGQFRGMLYGLPSIWNRWLLITAMSLLPLAFLWPVLTRSAGRLRRRFARRGRDKASRLPRILRPDSQTPAEPALHLSLWHRCLCIFLAAIFLIGPETFQSLA